MQEWYKTWFGKEYLELYAHRDEHEAKKQVEFILSQLQTGSEQNLFSKPTDCRGEAQSSPEVKNVLDVACGNGRHLIEFAKRGFSCTGNDLSEVLIEVAKENAAKNNLKIEFHNADMRSLPLADKSFDLVISMFTSFGYFETDEQHVDTLKEWRRVLKDDGILFIDYLNKDYLIENLVPESVEVKKNKEIKQTRYIRNNRIEKAIIIKDLASGKSQKFKESIMLYDKRELALMLKSADFKNVDFYEEDPSRLMLIAEKK